MRNDNPVTANEQMMQQQVEQHTMQTQTQTEQTMQQTAQMDQLAQQMDAMQEQRQEQQQEQRPAEAVQRMRSARMRHVPLFPPIQRTAEVTPDPYAGMSERERKKAIKREEKARKVNRDAAKKAKQSASEKFGIPYEQVAPDTLNLLAQAQKFFSEQQMQAEQPFDLMAVSQMQLDITCLEDRDFVNTGKTIDLKKALQQRADLKKLWDFRKQHRDQWNELDNETKARCAVLLDQYPVFNEYLTYTCKLRNLYIGRDDKDDINRLTPSNYTNEYQASEKKQRCMRDILEARKLTEASDLEYYRTRENHQMTKEERNACITQEKEAYRAKFGPNQPLMKDMSTDERQTMKNKHRSVPKANKTSVTNATQAFLDHVSRREKKSWPDLAKRQLDRDIMIARGAQNAELFSDPEFLKSELEKAAQMMDDIETLCKLDTGIDVPDVTYAQVLDRVYQHFETCFERFRTDFEQVRAQLKTALTPEGLMVQQSEIGRFYGYWQALSEVYGQSPSLTARIPEEQLVYLRSISLIIFDYPGNCLDQDFAQNTVSVGDDLCFRGDLSINANEIDDMARSNAYISINTSLEDCPPESLTYQRTLKYAESTDIRPGIAYQVLRHMGYQEEDEKVAEKYRMGQDDTDLSNMDLLQVMDYRREINKQINRANIGRISTPLSAKLEEQHDKRGEEILRTAAFRSLSHEASGLSLSRTTNNIHILMPEKSDEEIVEFYLKQIRLQEFVEKKQRVNVGNATEDEIASVTAEQAEMEQMNSEMLDEWKRSLENTYNAIQQKFGRMITQLHIVDFFQLCGPEMERYLQVIQDLYQIQTLLNREGRLTPEENALYDKMAEQTLTLSNMWGMRDQIMSNQLSRNPRPIADLLEVYVGSRTMTDQEIQGGPSMNEDEMEVYIRSVRERYPDMLYGRFR